MVEVCALASGSNGNRYYIGDEKGAVLIDAGINCKQLLLRLEGRQLDPSKIKAVFVSHEHTDHIAGLRVFCNKLKIPAFFTPGTFMNTASRHKPKLYRFFEIGDTVTFDDFEIHAFTKNHDASEPCSFRIELGGQSIGVITDLGSLCQPVIDHLRLCDVLFLESNYDEKMLWEGAYPWPLKKRIASDVGHLSNEQAMLLVTEHANSRLHTIFLSHLSGENNTPDLAFQTFYPLTDRYTIIKTSRHEATGVYRYE